MPKNNKRKGTSEGGRGKRTAPAKKHASTSTASASEAEARSDSGLRHSRAGDSVEGWSNPDPTAVNPFTEEHFAFLEKHNQPKFATVCRRYNHHRFVTKDLKPKRGQTVYQIMPSIPVRAIADGLLKDCNVSIHMLNYSPTALHENAIGDRHPAEAVDVTRDGRGEETPSREIQR